MLGPRIVPDDIPDDDALETTGTTSKDQSTSLDYADTEDGTTQVGTEDGTTLLGTENGDGEPPAKRVKLSGAAKKKAARLAEAERKKEKGKKKGMNTGRKFARVKDETQLCWKAAVGTECAQDG